MPLCLRCGKELEMGSGYCPYCGEEISASPFDPPVSQIDEEEYRTFIRRNADYYLNKFRNFQSTGTDSFAVTWNWPAFWLGFAWMLYRKMYLWATVAFFIALTPVGFPLTMIGWGITCNYLYYFHARKKILGYRSNQSPDPNALSLAELGGVNRWVWFLGIVFILFLLAFGALGLLLLLHFLKYRFLAVPDFLEI
jgi:hypothetical protein